MQIVCLIPARGGSIGVPKKNIVALFGKHLIGYTIETALKVDEISNVIVITDDKEIAEIAKSYGAEVPFIRPSHLATSNAKDIDVLKHLIEWKKSTSDSVFDYIVYLRPTTPFKSAKTIKKCIDKMNSEGFSSVRTVTKVEGVYHPYWMFKDNKGRLDPFIDGISISKYYQRQLLPDCYRLNGVVDILIPSNVLNNDMWGQNTGFVVTEESESIDIDTQEDLEYCEFLMKKRNNQTS